MENIRGGDKGSRSVVARGGVVLAFRVVSSESGYMHISVIWSRPVGKSNETCVICIYLSLLLYYSQHMKLVMFRRMAKEKKKYGKAICVCRYRVYVSCVCTP